MRQNGSCEGCDRAIPGCLVKAGESEARCGLEVQSDRMGLLAGGAFGEMMETVNLHHDTNREPLYDASYANSDLVDNDI